MTVRFRDPGGEYYFSRTIAQAVSDGIWSDLTQVTFVNTAPAGRYTTYSLFSSAGSGVFIGAFTGSTGATLIAGWAQHNASSTFVNNNRIFAWTDGATQQCDLRTDGSGHVFFTRNGTAIGSASANVLSTGWHYYEVKTTFATGATGTCEFRVDGVVWLTTTSVQNTTSGNARANKFFIRPIVENTNQYYKDFYCLDTGTGVNTTYLGDVTVAVIWPNAAGTNQQWAANTGTQTAAVQDGIAHSGTWPDGDTTYIGDGTSGHISDFQHQSITVTGSIFEVCHISYARKDIAGAQSMNQVALQSGSVVETGSTIALGNSYLYYFDGLEQNPTGPAAWVDTTFNATDFGVKIP